MDHQKHTKVERFLKLGYSRGDILRVLDSLRHDAQTNDILEELIKTCHTRTYSNKSASAVSTASPKLVPRGCSVPQPGQSTSPALSRPSSATDREPVADFRPVVIDGSNVAMSHGDKKVFSCQGLQLAVKWFWDKGLRDITVFVPLWRKEQPRPEAPITDQHILHELERRKILVYTPSRCVNGKRVVCYDDRYIIKLAFDSDGIVVSNDNYRDLQTENPLWKKFIEERLLMYTFANNKFMPPDDPLGRNGPTIDDFLRKKPWAPDNKQQHCPYGKKCTYGVKCKFYHPERTNQSQLSVADELRAMSRPAADRAKPFTLAPAAGQDTHHCPTLCQLEHPVTHPHMYPSSTPPPLSTEDPSHRASPSESVHQRDTSSPRNPPSSNTSLRLCPSPDVDEAFGSLESHLSWLHIQDRCQSSERLSYAYSSGVASCSQSHEEYFPSGSYSGNMQRPCLGGHPSGGYYPPHTSEPPVCGQCRFPHRHTRAHRPLQSPAGSSCPSLLPPQNGDHPVHFSEEQYFPRQPFPHRQSQSLPEDPWVPGGLSSRRSENLGSEQRNSLRSQLSPLFPQSMVEHVMSIYPHVVDLTELISLIQMYRTSVSYQ